MEFVLTFQQPVAVYETNADPIKGAPEMQAWRLYMDSMVAAGVMRGGNRLNSFAATTVGVRRATPSPGRSVRRHQGYSWRLCRDRCTLVG